MPFAPCIAVVGPANAGKTTLLNQLDERLQRTLSSFMVVKGNPDGTGRYLYYSPQLRHDPAFKSSIKGRWDSATVAHIHESVLHARRNLSLALLDFGGRHDAVTAPGNAVLFSACTHYLIVSRHDDPLGAAFWNGICRAAGLTRLGWLRSTSHDGPPPLPAPAEYAPDAHFRWDVHPGDPANNAALTPLIASLLALSIPLAEASWIDLHHKVDWDPAHLSDCRGLAPHIAAQVRDHGEVAFGGRAPVWAYLAALRCAVAANPAARVSFLDPQLPESLVSIPAEPDPAAPFPPDTLRISFAPNPDRDVLSLTILTPDLFLPSSAARNLAGAPPLPRVPSERIGISGRVPLWLFGVYARWLLKAGVTHLSSWDGRTTSFIP